MTDDLASSAKVDPASAVPCAPLPTLRDRLALKPESDELLHLDLMRLIAACGVLFHHSHLFLYPEADRARISAQTDGLGLFVDLFFVISGFVIAYVYADRIKSPADFGRFMQRRVGRLVPLHLLTMAVAVAVTLGILATGFTYNSTPSFSTQCLVSTALLVHEIVPCGGPSFNAVNWSISVEMALYCLFPLLLVATRGSALRAWAITGAIILGMVTLSDDLHTTWYDGYRPIRGIASFAFGMGLYHMRARLGRIPGAAAWLLVSTAALIAAMMGGAGLLLCMALVYATGTFAVAADMRKNVHPLVLKLAPLGQLTYSLYMIHWTVFVVVIAGIGDKLLRLSTGPMLVLIALTYALIFALALLSYALFEKPARGWIDGLPLFPKRGATQPARPRHASPGDSTGS